MAKKNKTAAPVNNAPPPYSEPGRVKIRDLNPLHTQACLNEYEEYFALAMNSVRIKCKDNTIPFTHLQENFIKYQLLTCNVVGYDKLTKRWAIAYGFDLNDYWKPNKITFVFPNKKSYTRTASYRPEPAGAYLIEGLPANQTIGGIIAKGTDLIQACDETIIQNITAVKTPAIMKLSTADKRLSLLNAIRDRQTGEPVIMVDEDIANALQGVPTYTEYIAGNVEDLRERARSRLLNKLGTMSIIAKAERVQASEVNANVGQAEDYIYAFIDNVNNQFKTYGLPFEMVLNTSLEELYVNSFTESNTDSLQKSQNATDDYMGDIIK